MPYVMVRFRDERPRRTTVPRRPPSPRFPLVRQPNNWGCGLACVAMVAGRTYAEVEALARRGLGAVREGTSPGLLWVLLSHLGFAARVHYAQNARSGAPWPPPPIGDAQLLRVMVYGEGHWVVWDGAVVRDPAREGAHPLAEYAHIHDVIDVIPTRP